MVGRLTLIALGAAYYAACLARAGGYRGHQRFYATAQDTGLLARAAQAFLTAAPMQLAGEYRDYQQAVGRDRISPMATVDYSDDTLAGYADEQFGKGGESLADQQRGLLLPLVERAAAELPDGSVVVEIGTGNGDVCAHLAAAHPALEIVGVDLSTKVAVRKHRLPNLRFPEGYALDQLEAGELRGDLVFASSTFVVFAPLELARYCQALAASDCKRVVLNEPTWGGHPASSDGVPFSRHLEGAVWHHNYAGYLRRAGFEIVSWSCEPYRPPGSSRPDVRVTLLEAWSG